MQIVVPGTAGEFDRLFGEAYANGSPTYYRLSATSNPTEYPVRFGKLEVVQRGSRATIVAVGPTLSAALPAVKDLDVTVLYCTTVAPFDAATLRGECQGLLGFAHARRAPTRRDRLAGDNDRRRRGRQRVVGLRAWRPHQPADER